MKKKLGIITFTCANNYGAILQNHALDAWLSTNLTAYDVYTIDYVSDDIRRNYDPSAPIRPPFKSYMDKALYLWRWFNGMRLRQFAAAKDRRFSNFKKEYLHLSDKIDEKKNLKAFCESFDTLISGSDQVLNPFITHSDWDVYSLALFSGVRKIGYATSAGSSKRINDDILSALYSFDALSVREKELRVFLNGHGIYTKLVCDPVVLMTRDYWSSLADSGDEVVKGRYIFIYLADELSIGCALKLGKLTGLPIIYLGFSSRLIGKAQFVKDAGPLEFVRLLRDADYVVTPSFHATVFSTIFEKKFFCTAPEDGGSRVPDFVHEVGLDSSLVRSVGEISADIQYPWSDVRKRLASFRASSEAWIEMVVK